MEANKDRVAELIENYRITLVGEDKLRLPMSEAKRAEQTGDLDEIKALKFDIINRIKADKAEAEARRREREQRIAAIEGLEEVRAAIADAADWKREFDRSFEGDCGGIVSRPRPVYDFKAMREKYPRATAYMDAEKAYFSANAEVSEIGEKALQEVIYGDYKKAMADMEQDMRKFADRHTWD